MSGWMRLRKKGIEQIGQTENADCALACLTMIARFHGNVFTLGELKNRFTSGSRGLNLQSLVGFAGELGLLARSLRTELEDLDDITEPVILHWNLNHFVVYSGKTGNRYKINDPAAGPRLILREEMSRSFTGVLVTFEPTGQSLPASDRNLGMLSFLGREPGLIPIVLKVASLSVILQTAILVAPFLLQLTLDRALPAGDRRMVVQIVLVFAVFMIVQVAAGWVRGSTLNKMAAGLSLRFSAVIASTLMRIEPAYFLRRGIGDILSRMLSVAPVRDILSGRLGSVALDVVMAAGVIIILLVYAPLLAAISVASLAAQAALQLWLAPRMRNRQSDSLIAKAKEQSLLVESIRGITTLKLYNLESSRLSTWYSHLTDTTEAEYQISRMRLLGDTSVQLIVGLEFLLLVYLGAGGLITGSLTVGQFVAYLAYRQIVVSKMPEITRFVVDLKIASLHLERISDVVNQREDRTLAIPSYIVPDLIDEIELHGITFAYTPQDPNILEKLSLRVSAGDHIAIKGVSGSGKSTLVRLLLGLVEHDAGTYLVNGIRIEDYGYPNYRKRVASVLQDDNLFTGSILQNIAMFDESVEFLRVQQCAVSAGIHSEILEMAMAYQTLVSDSGANISGGQKQRLLIARALYKRPQVLIIDEGTANLDVELEKLVNDNIQALNITRIVFAHRPQTLDRADIVYRLQDGTLEIDDSSPRHFDCG